MSPAISVGPRNYYLLRAKARRGHSGTDCSFLQLACNHFSMVVPMTQGYSDRINHAFAYASLHPPGKQRKGTRVPYLTHPGNVAVILARYGCDEATIAAGILHDVVEDCEEKDHTRELHLRQISEKFGAEVATAVESVTHRQYDVEDEGRRLEWGERMDAYLSQLGSACERARWVCAADKLHNSRATLSDLARAGDPDAFWNRFTKGRQETVRWYRRVYERLVEVGFTAPILAELRGAVEKLEEAAGVQAGG
jgi:(p)ppGpp synthase/HD superfamily hydrolase